MELQRLLYNLYLNRNIKDLVEACLGLSKSV
jgi:hypothetical protein